MSDVDTPVVLSDADKASLLLVVMHGRWPFDGPSQITLLSMLTGWPESRSQAAFEAAASFVRVTAIDPGTDSKDENFGPSNL